MRRSLDGKVHCWEGLSLYNFNEEEVGMNIELGVEGTFKIAQRLNKNQYFIAKAVPLELNSLNQDYNPLNHLTNYIETLKLMGLDIGKGDCEFGYKMPLPKKQDTMRELIIFRRK